MMQSGTQRLEAWVARTAGAERAAVTRLDPVTGGAGRETWWVDLDLRGGNRPGAVAAVLRADGAGATAVGHDALRAFTVMDAAHRAGAAAPEPLWHCPDDSVLGRPFHLRARIAGRPLDGEAESAVCLAPTLAATLARLHAVTPPRPDLDLPPPADAGPVPSAIADVRAWLDARATPRPALEWGLRWLERNGPPGGTGAPVRLVHGDLHPDNVLVGPDGELAGLIGWDHAGWGDPREDLGALAAAWDGAAGESVRDALARAYAEASGRPVDAAALVYWEVLALVRRAARLAGRAEGFRADAGHPGAALALGLAGHAVPALEEAILHRTERDL